VTIRWERGIAKADKKDQTNKGPFKKKKPFKIKKGHLQTYRRAQRKNYPKKQKKATHREIQRYGIEITEDRTGLEKFPRRSRLKQRAKRNNRLSHKKLPVSGELVLYKERPPKDAAAKEDWG